MYFSITNNIKYCIASVAMFLYIYTITFKHIPIGSRAALGLFGFVLFVINFLKKDVGIVVDKSFLKFYMLLFSVGIIAFFSISYNGTFDFEFVRYVASITLVIFSSYFVISVLKAMDYQLSFNSISLMIINVVFIQALLASLMFIFPDLRDFLINIQTISELAEQQMGVYEAYRLIGFGSMFFEAGIISGYALILIALKLRLCKYSSIQLFFLSLKFIFILIIGMSMARTTFIGFLIALSIICLPTNFKPSGFLIKNRVLFLLYISTVPAFSIVTLLFVYPEFAETIEGVIAFAFEMFINYSDKGSFNTDSTDVLKSLFVWPTDIKTYLIGDGYFSDPHGNGYYMSTDVGYLRLIYYFGFAGLSMFFIMQYCALANAFKGIGVPFVFYIFIFIYLIILNLKGFSDILSFTLLYWIYFLADKKTNEGLQNSAPLRPTGGLGLSG